MAKFHENAPKLMAMIDGREKPLGPEAMFKFINDDPTVLACFGAIEGKHAVGSKPAADPDDYDGTKLLKYQPPLAYAVENDNLPVAEAILKVMSDPVQAKKIMKQLEDEGRVDAECDRGHPFYFKPTDDEKELPHCRVISTGMLERLHHYGYDLTKGFNIYEHLLNITCECIDRATIGNFVYPLLREAVKLGVDTRRKRYPGNVGLGVYAYSQLCDKMPEYLNTAGGGFITLSHDTLKLMARLGIDFRDVLQFDLQKLMTPKNSSDEEKEAFTITQQEIRRFVQKAPKNYHESDPSDKQNRAEYARAACAGNTFPELLGMCVEADRRSGTRAATDEVLRYLDDFWKGEYWNSIRNAEASLTRTTPLEKSALADYVRGDSLPTARR